MAKHPSHTGPGGELHQTANGGDRLTTNHGNPISDDQNSLKAGARGPGLFEDFQLREKITHFDHERIPERVVHARGYGAKGIFEPYGDVSSMTRARFLDPSETTPVFVRFSTVAGNAGSFDLARDARGFATKFYTSEGNFDLVGNNIPVFFIQDAIKFPDLVHAVKQEPDRGFPQAQSAHDTFWDFVGLIPESVHMLMWTMSDRGIPRSFRMMEGFGVHTYRFVNAQGASTFVKFHWKPVLGKASVIWDEAVKINGADPDFHRRDLWEAIEAGDFPEYELGVQAFDQATADALPFDILDATKLIPEETVPVTKLGKMTLNENVKSFFAETEQVAFCVSHLVPGIDFTDDPLLQGRIHSYLDTQLKRLGGPNFHEIPVNRPRCPMHNLQQGGHMRMEVSEGRVAYEPSSLPGPGPREDPENGYTTYPQPVEGEKRRTRPETFADHYSQARQFYISQTEPERLHIVNGFAFELGKCTYPHVRKRMLGHLENVHPELAEGVASALGMSGEAERIEPAVPVRTDLEPSPALSLYATNPAGLKGKKIGILTSQKAPDAVLSALSKVASSQGAMLEVVAPTRAGVKSAKGKAVDVKHALAGAPSVLFDAVVLAPSEDAAGMLASEADAIEWAFLAYRHLKVIAFTKAAEPILKKAGVLGAVDGDPGLVRVDASTPDFSDFIEKARGHRIWSRESKLSSPG